MPLPPHQRADSEIHIQISIKMSEILTVHKADL